MKDVFAQRYGAVPGELDEATLAQAQERSVQVPDPGVDGPRPVTGPRGRPIPEVTAGATTALVGFTSPLPWSFTGLAAVGASPGQGGAPAWWPSALVGPACPPWCFHSAPRAHHRRLVNARRGRAGGASRGGHEVRAIGAFPTAVRADADRPVAVARLARGLHPTRHCPGHARRGALPAMPAGGEAGRQQPGCRSPCGARMGSVDALGTPMAVPGAFAAPPRWSSRLRSRATAEGQRRPHCFQRTRVHPSQRGLSAAVGIALPSMW